MTKNTLKTFVFLAALTGLVLGIGNMFPRFMPFAILLVVAMNVGGYFFSDKIVIAMTRSRPVTEAEAPWLYRIVGTLAERANMPMPRLYVMPASQPNAFATGRNPQHAAVAVTEGILDVLSERELEGVLAHELAHVRNRDILIGAVAAMAAGVVTMLARLAMWGALLGGRSDDDDGGGVFGALFMMILAPIAAFMIQMAVSRSREAHADASGAELLGDATPLAQALIKIDAAKHTRPEMAVNPAVSHVFLQNPFRGNKVSKLFMSHPPLEERLEQLRKLGAQV